MSGQESTPDARCIREEIYEDTGLTASAGIGPSKFVARVASDRDKPNGLTVVRPEDQNPFIAELAIEEFHGIGPVTTGKMQGLGIDTGADLQETPERKLTHHFGLPTTLVSAGAASKSRP